MKANHQVNVIRVPEVLVHPNADALELLHINGYQVVVKKGQFKAGELAVYIQPDSVVPQTEPFRFIYEPYIDPLKPEEPVSERRRRITVRKFRGEWSEGLLLPLSDFFLPDSTVIKGVTDEYQHTFNEGDDVATLLGITHYDPDAGKESTAKGDNESAPRKKPRWPRSFKGWFFYLLNKIGINVNGNVNGWDREYVDFSLPVYDVDAYKNFTSAFEPGEMVVATEKIHGSNARYVFIDGKMYAGSRQLWKAPTSNCIWRKALKAQPWIEEWCRAHEGYALYGEVTPTQGKFDYGCKDGDIKFFVFDVRTPEGRWLNAGECIKDGDMSTVVSHWVPSLYVGPFDIETIKKYVDGPSTVPGAKHIREGVVVKPITERSVPGLGRLILKVVSSEFLLRDSK